MRRHCEVLGTEGGCCKPALGPDYSLVEEGRPTSLSGGLGVFSDKPPSGAEPGGVSGLI